MHFRKLPEVGSMHRYLFTGSPSKHARQSVSWRTNETEDRGRGSEHEVPEVPDPTWTRTCLIWLVT